MLRPSPHLLIAALAATAACADDPAGPTPPPELRSELPRDPSPDVSPAELAEAVAGNRAFAADLYRTVRSTDGNLFMSPHSISTALAMTYAGAAGDTAAQLAGALHFTLPPAKLHAALSALDFELASRASQASAKTIPFRLTTSNAIWNQHGMHVESAFLDTLAVNYGAGVKLQDFAADPEAARATINGWVEHETNGKIEDLLPQGTITNATRVVLTNAIYFTAAWATPFESSATASRPFHAAGGVVSVPTLHQVAELGYGEGDGFAAAELPYDGGQLSMVVVVPTGDLAALEAGLNGAVLDAITASLSTHQLTLSLPKFDFDAPLGLKDVLRELGVIDAFDDAAADFSGITGRRDLVITDVLHKGFVSIDEKGTEAAAATAVVIGPTSVPPSATLAVDKPFLFFIRDRPTGAILFVGRVVDPR